MKKATKEPHHSLNDRIDVYCEIIKHRLLEESGKNGGRKWNAVLREELRELTIEVIYHFHPFPMPSHFFLPVNKTKNKTKT